MQCPVGSMPRVKVARHANANAKAPDCGSKSGDAGRSLRAADGVAALLCAARRGETNSFRPFSVLLLAPRVCDAADKGNTGQLCESGEERRQGIEREACWLVG